MRPRQHIAALGLAAAGLTLPMTAAAEVGDPTIRTAVVTDEQDCVETIIARAVTMAGLDPLVPDEYALFSPAPGAARLSVITYTCEGVSVDGQPVVGRDKTTTVSIGSAQVTHRDGQPLAASEAQYIVWYGTDNPVLFAKLQQTGLPVSFLPRASTTVTEDAGGTTVVWDIVGAGLDYTVTATHTAPDAPQRTSTTIFWHDGAGGDLRVTYHNDPVALSTALIKADFTGNELLSRIIAVPRLLTINSVSFPYQVGSWTSQVDVLG